MEGPYIIKGSWGRVCQAMVRARAPKLGLLACLRSRVVSEIATRWLASTPVWHGEGVRENGSGGFGKVDRHWIMHCLACFHKKLG